MPPASKRRGHHIAFHFLDVFCIAQYNLRMSDTAPTQEVYQELQKAYDWFNQRLFDNSLPHCLITLQREKDTCGYYSQNRFGNHVGRTVDEIALNPSYFAITPLVETFQTLVHEQAHVWQHHHGNPGRGRYHNEEWASKMESIGLMPSSTGRPGGRRTGDRIADYAIEGGLFLKACEELITEEFRISWYDRFPTPRQVLAGSQTFSQTLATHVGGGVPLAETNATSSSVVMPASGVVMPQPKTGSTRSKYTCKCNFNVWGKPGLSIYCGVCKTAFEDTSEA